MMNTDIEPNLPGKVNNLLGAGGINIGHLNVASVLGPHQFDVLEL